MSVKKPSLKPKMLLHVCCANCLLYPYELLRNNYEITLYFYNPNIHPKEEYVKRLSEVKRVSGLLGIALIIGRYECREWFKLTENFANEPEGGKRCSVCFYLRLKKTAVLAAKEKYDIFTSTLSVSPHKNPEMINATGEKIASESKVSFFSANFKKNNGFKKTMQMAKELNIYRQNYCGCIFSKRTR